MLIVKVIGLTISIVKVIKNLNEIEK